MEGVFKLLRISEEDHFKCFMREKEKYILVLMFIPFI